jgi:hypothetical protein
MKKLPTIILQNKPYVQVNQRVIAFNELYKNGKIETQYKQEVNTIIFKSKVTPDVAVLDRYFTGHSFGELGKEKALEKLETVSVGRALALLGIGIVEGIASADEMDRFNRQPKPVEDTLPILDEESLPF